MRSSRQSSYFFGMWRNYLLWDLCWYRESQEGAAAIPGIPSFSWASVNSPVNFANQMSKRTDLSTKIVEYGTSASDVTDCEVESIG